MKNPRPTGLTYPYMKTRRAKEHLDALNAELVRYGAGEYCTVVKQDDVQNARHIIRLEMSPVPEAIPLLIGEFAYCLRSGLDQLAWQLALLNSPQPSRNTAFPVLGISSRKSRAQFDRSVESMGSVAVMVIEELQPYHRGAAFKDHPLWQLNHLCNLDKHVMMAVNSTSLGLGVVQPESVPPFVPRELHYGIEITIPLSLKDEVEFYPQPPEFIFGEPIDSTGQAFEIRESGLADIYNFVRDHVLPRFACFF
jgi:hypothetical protein